MYSLSLKHVIHKFKKKCQRLGDNVEIDPGKELHYLFQDLVHIQKATTNEKASKEGPETNPQAFPSGRVEESATQQLGLSDSML